MHGRTTSTGIELSVSITQSELASLAGVSRQYMNELISEWNEKGLMVWKGNSAPILKIDELRKLLSPVDDWMAKSEGWA